MADTATPDQATQVLAELEKRQIRRVKVGGFDVDGVLRGKYMSVEKFRSALGGGFGFCDVIFGWDIADNLYDRSSVTGWERGFPDAGAVLDPSTLRFSPWEPATATMLCDFRDENGAPHPACPRSLLKKAIGEAEAFGFTAKFACEYEFFFFKETPDTLHDKGFRELSSLTPGMFGYSWLRTGQNRELMADILDQLAAFDIDVEALHTETGPGVFEGAIRYDDTLRAADKAALFKVGLKQIAREHGLSVTFMAKWNANLPGSSGHVHQSLWANGENAFHNASGAKEMAYALKHYVGGLCLLMPELTAMVSPNVNTYKRYVPGVWAPLTATWGVENRTCAVRLIGLDSNKAARVEFRQPAADLNPYLAFAACLSAGMYGIRHKIEPPPEASGDASHTGTTFPRTLAEAATMFHASERAKQMFGEDFVNHYAMTRQWEVQQYQRAVTSWELERYFEAV